MIFTLLVACAKFERFRIRERIQDNKTDSRARGLFLGGTRPFGWQICEDGALVEDGAEQSARHRILELRAGGASLRRIAEIIGRDGFKISHEGVSRVLEQEAETARIAAE